MKKYFILIPVLLLVALPVSAAEFVGNNTNGYSLPQGSTLAKDLYAGAKQISIDGTIDADATIAGEILSISGEVREDLIAGGRTVTLSGIVGHDVRTAGQTITVSGAVHGDVVAAGETLTIAEGAIVDGDVLFFGQTLTIMGEVRGEVHMWGDELSVTGARVGSITARANMVHLTGARVAGDVTYYSNNELVKDSATIIGGEVSRIALPSPAPMDSLPFADINFTTLLMALAMTALAVWLFASPASVAVSQAVARPVRTIAVGIGVLIAIPIVSLLLLFTIIGLPLGLLLLCAYGVLIIVAKVLSGILVGAVVSKWITKEYQVTYLWAGAGVVVLTLVPLVPLVGWIPGWLSFIAMAGVVFRAVEHMLFSRSASTE